MYEFKSLKMIISGCVNGLCKWKCYSLEKNHRTPTQHSLHLDCNSELVLHVAGDYNISHSLVVDEPDQISTYKFDSACLHRTISNTDCVDIFME